MRTFKCITVLLFNQCKPLCFIMLLWRIVGVHINVQLTAFTCRNSVIRKICTNHSVLSVDNIKLTCFDDFQKFPDLKFKYVEEESPEEFFIPYVWSLVYHASNMYFNASRILLFSLSASWGRPGARCVLNSSEPEHSVWTWKVFMLWTCACNENGHELEWTKWLKYMFYYMYMFLLMNGTDLQYM